MHVKHEKYFTVLLMVFGVLRNHALIKKMHCDFNVIDYYNNQIESIHACIYIYIYFHLNVFLAL